MHAVAWFTAALTVASCSALRGSHGALPTVTDGRFRDPRFNLTLTLPAGWHPLPRELCEKVEARMREQTGGHAPLCRLMAVHVERDGRPETNPLVMIAAEKLPIPDLTADEYVSMQKRDDGCDGPGARTPVAVGAASAVTFAQHCVTSERQYVAIVRDGYGMLVMGAWHVAAQRDDVRGVLDSVRVLP